MKEKILVVGSGAREHAIGWKIKKDFPDDRELFFAPGNDGMQNLGKNIDIDSGDINKLVSFASDNNIDITIVGPEGPLANGIVDAFGEEEMSIFGPTKEAAILESDKAEALFFMQRHHIPHPNSRVFEISEEAEAFVKSLDSSQIVIKASGLCAGKGVVLPDSREDAINTVRAMMVEGKFGDPGRKIVIQERMFGKEVSVIGFVANEIGLLVPARDYKRAYNGDKGPNTGGMGGYAPNENLSLDDLQEIRDSILTPTVQGMKEEGRPFCGVLYVGVMLTEKGPKVIEYNVRFGDPETQIQLRLLKSDLLGSIKACFAGKLSPIHYQSSNKSAIGVVIAADGYPGEYKKGNEIRGLDRDYSHDIVVFHGGANGGRVVTVTAIGENMDIARRGIYQAIGEGGISVEKGFYRSDI